MIIVRHDLRLHLQMNNPDGNELWRQSTLRKCGQFIVKGPNRVWSIDGHDKFHVLDLKYMDALMHIHGTLFGVTWDILIGLRYVLANNIWRLSALREIFQSSFAQIFVQSYQYSVLHIYPCDGQISLIFLSIKHIPLAHLPRINELRLCGIYLRTGNHILGVHSLVV